MDINVQLTIDASDKLVHLIHELASAVSLCGKPERRAAYEVSATPERVPTTADKMSAVENTLSYASNLSFISFKASANREEAVGFPFKSCFR